MFTYRLSNFSDDLTKEGIELGASKGQSIILLIYSEQKNKIMYVYRLVE